MGSGQATYTMTTDSRTSISVELESNFDFWKDSVRVRVEMANHTSSRARYTLIFLSLVSASFIVSLFSYFYSWNRHFVYEFLDDSKVQPIRDGIIKEWLSTQTYQLPILGIKIMASDIQIFGPLVLLVVSTWNYYEVRREHYTTGRLLGDVYITLKEFVARNETKALILSQEVYHSLISYTVFNVIPYDKPILTLDEPLVSSKNVGKPTLGIRSETSCYNFIGAYSALVHFIRCRHQGFDLRQY